MATIYKHSWFMGNTRRDGSQHLISYYAAKGVLLKEGYKLISYNKNWKETGRGEIDFSNGVCFATIRTSVSKNDKTGKWSCGVVLDVREWTID